MVRCGVVWCGAVLCRVVSCRVVSGLVCSVGSCRRVLSCLVVLRCVVPNSAVLHTCAMPQVMTGEDWNQLMYDGMRATSDLAALYFVSCFVIGNYLILNLFIAMLIGHASTFQDETPADDAHSISSPPPSPFQGPRQAFKHIVWPASTRVDPETGEVITGTPRESWCPEVELHICAHAHTHTPTHTHTITDHLKCHKGGNER